MKITRTTIALFIATVACLQPIPSAHGIRSQRKLKGKKGKNKPCDPADVNLADYAQWKEEVGYWIGEYTFLGADGDTFISSSWNYPYDHYKGFITGNIKG